jgi:hypothetical protein
MASVSPSRRELFQVAAAGSALALTPVPALAYQGDREPALSAPGEVQAGADFADRRGGGS